MAVTAQDVMSHLASYGLNKTVQEIEFVLAGVTDALKAYTNLQELPSALDDVVIERTCGNMLNFALGQGILTNDANVPKSVKIGDTTVDFGSVDSRAKAISLLTEFGQERVDACRRLRW